MIRKIKENDINRIIEIENKVFNHSLGYEFLKKASESSMAYVYVYEENKNILGYISSLYDGEVIEILNFCVDTDYQHKGIGKSLLSYLLLTLSKIGAKASILEVRESNLKAIDLYSKFNYKNLHKRKAYYSDGEDALVLYKEIMPFIEIMKEYYSLFTTLDENKDYISLINKDYGIKYDYNKFIILNDSDKLLKKLEKNNPYPYFRFDSKIKYDDIQNEKINIMMAEACNIKLDIKNYEIEEVSKLNMLDYINIREKANLKYGAEYAKYDARYKIDKILNNTNLKSYLIYDDNKVSGMLELFYFNDNAYIDCIYVNEENRLCGMAKALFMYALNDLIKNGICNIYLEALDDMIKIYEKWGFMQIDSYYAYLK